jgi:tryptophanase
MPLEPYKIKVVEPIHLRPRPAREEALSAARYNVFRLASRDVYIDLLTDSGTGAMSVQQWSALMGGDEAYAGSASFDQLRETVREIMGFEYVVPAHQGRGAEHILFTATLQPGQIVLNNHHFDTTRAHVEARGAVATDLGGTGHDNFDRPDPFKGDIDLAALNAFLTRSAAKVAMVMLTVTDNTFGGQPVSLANIRGAAAIARRHGVPFFIDAARFAENAYFIQQREAECRGWSIERIVKAMFAEADGCTMSGKKDALANIGGFVALRDRELYRKVSTQAILFEGFPTYGGLAGRDLGAMAQGLREALEESYLEHRIGQVAYLGERLVRAGVPVMRPFGGHAVYVDAARFLPHLARQAYPGQALTIALYLEAGIRTVEVGTVLAGRDPHSHAERLPELDLVRLALPRRVYTECHLDYVATAFQSIAAEPLTVRGVRITYEAAVLRHFTAEFALLDPVRRQALRETG